MVALETPICIKIFPCGFAFQLIDFGHLYQNRMNSRALLLTSPTEQLSSLDYRMYLLFTNSLGNFEFHLESLWNLIRGFGNSHHSPKNKKITSGCWFSFSLHQRLQPLPQDFLSVASNVHVCLSKRDGFARA